MGGTGEDAANPGSAERLRRQRLSRTAGFLLATPATSLFTRTPTGSPSQDEKGKRKSSHGGVSGTAKRRSTRTSGHEDVAKSSPLSGEFKAEWWNEAGPGEASGKSVASTMDEPSQQDLTIFPGRASFGSTVGLDTDPAQIVDMALRLSEGRRHQASGKRHVSTGTVAERVANTGNDGHDNQRTIATQILGSYTQSSTTTPDQTPSKNGVVPLSTPGLSPSPGSVGTTANSTLEISKATATRVQKAKTYLELAYEHRRLLAHLPPIRRPGVKATPGAELPVSKIYNPLQYARNRKLRLREKSGLTPEADGWYDVAKVRPWVDAAIDSHVQTVHDPTECIRLPPLHQQMEGDVANEHPTAENFSSQRQLIRPRRPKSDWVTHPGELLADAYWLEQGLNKTRILNRDNNAIYPADTQFQYAGWRQHAAPSEIPDLLPIPSPLSERRERGRLKSSVSTAPELPKFQPTHRAGKGSALLRGPRKLKKTFIDEAKDSTRKARELFDSDSDSDSSSDPESSQSESDYRTGRRGRRKNHSTSQKFNLPVGDPFAPPITSARTGNRGPDTGDSSPSDPSKRVRDHSSTDEKSVTQHLNRDNVGRTSLEERDRRGQDPVKIAPPDTDHNPSRPSAEYTSAASASASIPDLPSITINLSPPHSRTPSPSKTKGSGFFKVKRDRHSVPDLVRPGAESVDKHRHKSVSRDSSADVERRRGDSSTDSRGNSPFDRKRRASSPYDDSASSRGGHWSSTISRMSTRSTAAPPEAHSRIKGIFKGGRIAEIVGNEVSRVGDYIWKRDPPVRRPQSLSSVTLSSNHSSGTEDGANINGAIHKTPPDKARRSLSPDSDHGGQRTSLEKGTSTKQTQYYNPNLPSFTSPFERDRERQDRKRQQETETSEAAEEKSTDHISLQVAQRRSRSKSPRFNQLAPPKLDTSQTPSMSDARGGHEFGQSLDLTKSRSASQIFNDAIGHRPHQPDATGAHVANDLLHNGRGRRRRVDFTPSDVDYKVTRQDVMRTRALLMMISVKARSIMAVRTQPGMVTRHQGEFRTTNITDQRLSQGARHVQDARKLIAELVVCSERFNDRLHTFSQSTVGTLHGDLQKLEDQIETELTPRAQIAADNAGALSMKLTTTSTRAAKDVNDIISEAFRFRKRGPLRLLRLFGFGAIEWGVVGLLWFIWAVVTALRLVLGILTGVVKVVRWLLWID